MYDTDTSYTGGNRKHKIISWGDKVAIEIFAGIHVAIGI